MFLIYFVWISSFQITFFYSIDIKIVSQKIKNKTKNQKSNGKQKGQRAKIQIKKTEIKMKWSYSGPSNIKENNKVCGL
jgi:hypothetical protein